MLRGESLTAAFDMYNGRLQVLKKEITEILLSAQMGEIADLEGALRMSVIQTEVDEIQKCIYILHYLFEGGWYDEDR